ILLGLPKQLRRQPDANREPHHDAMKRAAIILCFAACTSDPGGVPLDAPSPDAGPPSAVDLLFVIEDSDGTVQQNFAMNLPVLVNALQHAPSGAPDLHIAIITPEMGAGYWTPTIGECSTPDRGNFITEVRAATDPACTTNRLRNGAHFFVDGATTNYTGDLA